MTAFKGFSDWIEIFRGGPVTDSAGVAHDGDALIEKALATFNAAEHEPPVVVGHPRDNAPAFGWVEGLKKEIRDGAAVLLAKVKNVVPEFADMVERGLFRKRSAAFYPDGSLRHVGFLGAAPPAVKGLEDMKFLEYADKDITLIEFEEAIDMADKDTKTFTEADIERARAEAADKTRTEVREQLEREFAEREATKAQEAARQANRSWLEGKVKDGTIPPAVAKLGVVAFMDALAVEGEFQFTEGKGKQAPAAWFKEFMTELFEGKFASLFSEFATKDKAADGADLDVIPDLTAKV